MAVPVETALRTEQIRHTRCSHPGFFDRKPVQALLAWLALAGASQRPWQRLLGRALDWPPRYLLNATIDGIVKHLRATQVTDVADVVELLMDHRERLDRNHERHAIDEFVATLQRAVHLESPAAILDALSLREFMRNEATASGEAAPVVVHDILYRLASQFRTVDELLHWTSHRGGDRDYDFGDQQAKTAPGAITLASVHQAKGLEWPHVAVLGPPDGMPDRRATTPARREEERRIAYVAATRARKTLLFGASPAYAAELSERRDGLSWGDYVAGRTGPRQQNPPAASPAERSGPIGERRREGAGTRADVGDWDASFPEGAVQRRGVWVLRVAIDGAVACACGLLAWRPQTGAACPDCGAGL